MNEVLRIGSEHATFFPILAALFIGLILGFAGSMPIAGPTAAVIVSRGLGHRRRDAIYIAIGSAIPEAIYAFMAFWGISAMMGRFPILLPLSRLVGCAALSAVGVHFLVRPREVEPAQVRSGVSGWRSALLGFTMTAANPTILASWSAAVGVAHATGLLRVNPRDALPFAGGVGVGVVGWFATLLQVLERFRTRVDARTLDRFIRALGGALVLLGIGMGLRVVAR